MTLNYTVEARGFSGPFDLLLRLVEDRRLSINEISLAQIADDYINFVSRKENMPVSYVTRFVVIAATLLLIKSKTLVPALEVTQEEEEDIHELENRLLAYKELLRLSRYVMDRYGIAPIRILNRHRERDPVFMPGDKLNIEAIRTALSRSLSQIYKNVSEPEVIIENVMSLEEKITDLAERIKRTLSMSFKDFADIKGFPKTKEQKLNIIVSFLATLELVKDEAVRASQDKHFGNIIIQNV